MKIDLHVHINRTSRCAREEPETMAKKAKEKGIEAIAVLDHHYYPNQEEITKAEKASGIKVFKGIEITIKMNGGTNDIVIISKDPPNFNYGKYHQPISEKEMPDLMKYVEETQGLMILAHPYRKNHPLYLDVSKYPPHAIEITSKNTKIENRHKIMETAKHYNIICLATSDAHKTRNIGDYYIDTDFPLSNSDNETDLANLIKTKKFTLYEKQVAPVQYMPRNY